MHTTTVTTEQVIIASILGHSETNTAEEMICYFPVLISDMWRICSSLIRSEGIMPFDLSLSMLHMTSIA
jgi:hypothetical protein